MENQMRSKSSSQCNRSQSYSVLPKLASKSLPGHKIKAENPKSPKVEEQRSSLYDHQLTLKQLRREHTVQLHNIQEEEQQKAQMAIKELRSRFHQEKQRDLENLRENLMKKFETEMQTVVSRKDIEISKLNADIERLKRDLQMSESSSQSTSFYRRSSQKGLSVAARDGFEAKLYQELREVQSARRQGDVELGVLREREKQTAYQMKLQKESFSAELMKVKKEADVEIRRLLEELKSKDRLLASLNGEVTGKSSKLWTMEKPSHRNSSSSSDENNPTDTAKMKNRLQVHPASAYMRNPRWPSQTLNKTYC